MNMNGHPAPERDVAADRSGQPASRIAAVDALRGLALAGMVFYHATWDLHTFGLSVLDPSSSPALGWFGHGVAAGFLFLSGLSLRLAEGARSLPHQVARLSVLALAAGGVTLATWAAVPDAAIRFGILHCLAVTNAIGLLMRGLSNRVLGLAAAVCLALPLGWPWPLDPAWAWLGLSATVPPTLDFRPVLPWLAIVLVGMVAGRTALVPWLAGKRLTTRVAMGMAGAGRHSLAIYLLHQPVLMGLFVGLTVATGAARQDLWLSTPTEASAFITHCSRTCQDAGGEQALCRATCHCVLTATIASAPRLGWLDRLRPAEAALQQAVTLCHPAAEPTSAGHQQDPLSEK